MGQDKLVKKEKYSNIDGLRAIAAISIVVMHVLKNTDYNLKGAFFEKVIGQFEIFVAMFFIISSFGMCCGYYTAVKEQKLNINQFYLKRIKKILPLFMLLVFIELVFQGFDSSALWEGGADIFLLFGFLPNACMDIVGVGWSLGVIFVFYFIFPAFVVALWTKKRAWVVFAISLFYFEAVSGYFYISEPIHRGNFLSWMCFFVAGGLVYLYKDKLIELWKKKSVKYILWGIFGITVVLFFMKSMAQYKTIITLSMFSVLLIFSICAKSRLLSNKYITFLGNISFEIYLSHMFVFRFWEKLNLCHITKNSLADYIITCIVVITGSACFSVIAQKCVGFLLNIKEVKQYGNKIKN